MSEIRRMAGTDRIWECVHCGGWHGDPEGITHTRDCAELTRLRAEVERLNRDLDRANDECGIRGECVTKLRAEVERLKQQDQINSHRIYTPIGTTWKETAEARLETINKLTAELEEARKDTAFLDSNMREVHGIWLYSDMKPSEAIRILMGRAAMKAGEGKL